MTNFIYTKSFSLSNKLLFETERSEDMLIWWLVSIKLYVEISYFYKILFLMSLFKQFTGKTVAFPSTDVITVTLLFTLKFICLRVSFCFLPQKIIVFFFRPFF